jgi:hypothetical protein
LGIGRQDTQSPKPPDARAVLPCDQEGGGKSTARVFVRSRWLRILSPISFLDAGGLGNVLPVGLFTETASWL